MPASSHDERRLADLVASNARREDECHARQVCTDPLLPQIRQQAFVDAVIDHLDLRLAFDLRCAELKAEAYDSIEDQVKLRDQQQREAKLLDGVVPLNGGPRG